MKGGGNIGSIKYAVRASVKVRVVNKFIEGSFLLKFAGGRLGSNSSINALLTDLVSNRNT